MEINALKKVNRYLRLALLEVDELKSAEVVDDEAKEEYNILMTELIVKLGLKNINLELLDNIMSEKERHEFEGAVAQMGNLEAILNQIMEYAQLNFSNQLDIEGGNEMLGSIATAVNILGEELKHNVSQLEEMNTQLENVNHFISEITDNISDVIYLYDPLEQKCTYVNKQLQPLLGYTGVEALSSSPELRGLFSSPLENDISAYTTIIGAFAEEVKIKSATGDWKWFRKTLTPFKTDDKGVALSILGTLTDITELKIKEEQLKQREYTISESLKEKQLLLQEIHHRVKNNLQIISGLIDLQSRRVDSKEVQLQLTESKNRIKSIALIHEKLYQSDNMAAINISEYTETLVESITGMYREKDSNRQINIHQQLEENVQLAIDKAVPFGLMLNEIITNSYKHAFKGKHSGNIWISLTKRNNKINLEIKDDGTGMDMEVQAKPVKSLGMKLIRSLSMQLGTTPLFTNNDGLITRVEIPVEQASVQ